MSVVSCLPFFLSGSVVTYTFLLMFVFGMLFKLIRG